MVIYARIAYVYVGCRAMQALRMHACIHASPYVCMYVYKSQEEALYKSPQRMNE